jgi:6-phosphogluconolactonase
MVQEALLACTPLPPANVFRMAGELPPETAARTYAQVIRRNFRLRGTARPSFDLILLGMGDDGHTASLFPGMPALDEHRRLVVGSDVPAYVRPAVPRITFTFPVLNAARNVLFLVTGANKATAVRAVWGNRQPGEPLPAARVQPVNGRLVWLLDSAAAAGLRST